MKKTVLITNDDGIFGRGLHPLIRQIKKVANTITVVPDREMSASSHFLTLKQPIRALKVSDSIHILNGTPADCARFGIIELGKCGIDLVISGINLGQNLGQDVIYSGTVAAAREAYMMKVSGFAVSSVSKTGTNFDTAAVFARELAEVLLASGRRVFLNVNVPDLPAKRIKGAKLTYLGTKRYEDKIQSKSDPAGMPYYWLKSRLLSDKNPAGTDINAVRNGMVSITPLSIDSTDYDELDRLNRIFKVNQSLGGLR
jgi:5'-nucleotidase